MSLPKLIAGCLICTMFCGDCLGMKSAPKRRLKSNWKTITVSPHDGKDEAVFHLDDYGRLKTGTFEKKTPRNLKALLKILSPSKFLLPIINRQSFDQNQKQSIKYLLPIINSHPSNTNDESNHKEHTVSNVETSQEAPKAQTDENDIVETNGMDTYEASPTPFFFEDENDFDLNGDDTMFQYNFFDDQFDSDDIIKI